MNTAPWPEPIIMDEGSGPAPNAVPVPRALTLTLAEPCAACGSSDWSSPFGERRTWSAYAGQYVPLHEGDCDVTYTAGRRAVVRVASRERPRVTNISRPFKASGKPGAPATLEGLD